MKKRPNKLEQFHLQRIKEIGCLACGQVAVIHHLLRAPKRRSWRWTAPLCARHHNMSNDSVHLSGVGEVEWFASKDYPDIVKWAEEQWEISKGKFV